MGAQFKARLKIDTVETPCGEFNLSEPPDTFGAELTCDIPTLDLASTPVAGNVTFEIGVKTASSGFKYITLVGGGRIGSREQSIGWSQGPADSLSMRAGNVAADKWSLAPLNPVTMYDPTKVEIAEFDSDDTGGWFLKVRDSDTGQIVKPVYEAVENLTLYQVLDRAYTARLPRTFGTQGSSSTSGSFYTESTTAVGGPGCGFTRVVTNIPDRAVSRAEFTLEGGWHAGALALISQYTPVFFTNDAGTILFIVDPERALPQNMPPTIDLPLSSTATLRESEETEEFTNRVMIVYQSDDEGGSDVASIDRLVQTESTSGTFGGADYVRTDTTQTVRDYYSGGLVINSQTVGSETKTYATVDGQTQLIKQEEQQDQFNGFGLKTGHSRTVQALITDPDGSSSTDRIFVTAFTETCTITWRTPQGSTRSWVQEKATYKQTGLAIKDGDKYYPALEANRANFIEGGSGQTLETKPLKTIVETLRGTGAGQTDILVDTTDHLIPSHQSSYVSARTGAPLINSNAGRTKSELVQDPVSVAAIGPRRALVLQGGDIGRETLIDLAKRKLKRLASPPKTVQIELPNPNWRCHRGTIVRTTDRAGNQTKYMVTGRTIRGQFDKGMLRIDMSLTARQLTT